MLDPDFDFWGIGFCGKIDASSYKPPFLKEKQKTKQNYFVRAS